MIPFTNRITAVSLQYFRSFRDLQIIGGLRPKPSETKSLSGKRNYDFILSPSHAPSRSIGFSSATSTRPL